MFSDALLSFKGFKFNNCIFAVTGYCNARNDILGGKGKMLAENIHYQHFFPICQMS